MESEGQLPTWDLFVSYASEDRDFVRALVLELKQFGLRIWYDERDVPPGGRIHPSIAAGIARSYRALVVLSDHYFGKHYTSRVELPALLSREDDGTDVVIPVWLNTTAKDVKAGAPLLGDRRPVVSDGHDARSVAALLAETVDPRRYRAVATRALVRNVVADVIGPVRTITWQGRLVQREHEVSVCFDDSRQSTIPVGLFFQGWDGTSLDVEWWNELSSEFLQWQPQRRENLQASVVLIATEHRLWCEPDDFSATGAAGASFTRVQRDSEERGITTLDLTYPLHGATWKRVVLATLGPDPPVAVVRRVVERSRTVLIEGSELIDQAFGGW
jgi:hypothetical protein